ncbi:hypothetical protein, partial [Mesorhizobium sp. M3A.F.Ca.ET.201.01.1.1]|uniref:hypothetical protein n=1 Tax=Mesorhizobium sp. M3A.F.Ca.ET.201.01.1.1 TaxID=2563946 RepID=UPI001AED6515
AKADELISAESATPKSSFFILVSPPLGVRLHRIEPESPICPGKLSLRPFRRRFPCANGTPGPLFETDVPERKNQNTQLVKYLFHFAW